MTSTIHISPLDESFIPAQEYNALPHITSVISSADDHQAVIDALLKVISEYEVDEIFSVHLVHKHFDALEGQIMVYETVQDLNHPEFQIFTPRSVEKVAGSVRGKYFLATTAGMMKAYEYTCDPLPDVSHHGDFIMAFSNTIMELGMERMFALTIRSAAPKVEYNEIEIPELRSTILVQKSDWAPEGASTDWANDFKSANAQGVPVREVYSGTKCAPHLMHSRASFEEHPTEGANSGIIALDGVRLAHKSEAFSIITRARHCISAI